MDDGCVKKGMGVEVGSLCEVLDARLSFTSPLGATFIHLGGHVT